MNPRLLPWPLLIILTGAVWAGDAPPRKPAIVDLGTFAKQLDSWAFVGGTEYPGATGTLTWLGTDGHAAPGVASLHGDFSAGGKYVGMRIRKINRLATDFACWIKPDGLTTSVMVRLTDAVDQTFQYRLPLVDGTEWQRIVVMPGTTVAESVFPGRSDGKWQGHIAAIVIGLNKADIIRGNVVTCLVDDVAITTPEP
jgi:hypothetical protein